MIAIIDYGAGNLRSVAMALERLSLRARVTSHPKEVSEADAILLPGVGAAGEAMKRLEALGLIAPLKRAVDEGKPFFGVCLGLQLLLDSTEEGNGRCLGIVPGQVKRLPPGLKVPHMGWNQVRHRAENPLFQGIPKEAFFYFVHSYYPVPEDPAVVAGETDYGVTFCSVLAKGNLAGTQFHPEKSGAWGLKLYENFFRFYGRG